MPLREGPAREFHPAHRAIRLKDARNERFWTTGHGDPHRIQRINAHDHVKASSDQGLPVHIALINVEIQEEYGAALRHRGYFARAPRLRRRFWRPGGRSRHAFSVVEMHQNYKVNSTINYAA